MKATSAHTTNKSTPGYMYKQVLFTILDCTTHINYRHTNSKIFQACIIYIN